MKQADCPYEAHLNFRKISIPAGGEQALQLDCWSVFHVRNGTGFYLNQQLKQELETGSVLLTAWVADGIIRASQLGELSLNMFSVVPARLTGLISLTEQSLLAEAATRKENCLQMFPPGSPVAEKMDGLQAGGKQDGLLFRLELLQLFVQMIGNRLQPAALDQDVADARTRLQLFLEQTPSLDLIDVSFNELAQRTRCTPRHLSRIFHELVGMSYSDKRTELRLERARELLATSDAKIVNVALESGFKSLSLFNLLFVRHYGISPGKWRQKHFGEKTFKPVAKKSAPENNQVPALRVIVTAGSGRNDSQYSGLRNQQRNDRIGTIKGVTRLSPA